MAFLTNVSAPNCAQARSASWGWIGVQLEEVGSGPAQLCAQAHMWYSRLFTFKKVNISLLLHSQVDYLTISLVGTVHNTPNTSKRLFFYG